VPAGELGAQGAPAAVLRAVHGIFRAAHALGDFTGREAVDEAQGHDVTLLGRKRRERLDEVTTALGGQAEDDRVIVAGRIETKLSELVEQRNRTIAFSADPLDLVFIEK